MKSKTFNFLILIPIIFVLCLTLTILATRSSCISPKADEYLSKVLKYSHEYGVKPELILAVINAESKFNSEARSSKGAIGLMQILPSTAKYIAQIVDYNGEIDLYKADCNIALGCAYIAYLEKRFQGKNEVVCAYNAGEGVVYNWLGNIEYSKDGKRLDKIAFRETRKYLAKVIKYEQKYKKYLQQKGYYAKKSE